MTILQTTKPLWQTKQAIPKNCLQCIRIEAVFLRHTKRNFGNANFRARRTNQAALHSPLGANPAPISLTPTAVQPSSTKQSNASPRKERSWKQAKLVRTQQNSGACNTTAGASKDGSIGPAKVAALRSPFPNPEQSSTSLHAKRKKKKVQRNGARICRRNYVLAETSKQANTV